MALNWVTVVDSRPLLLHAEDIIESVDYARCTLSIPGASQPSSKTSGGLLKKLEAVGIMTLTNQRLIWINPTADTNSPFKSLTVPLPSILSSKFEQPMFGANYLVIGVKPTAEGGLTDGTTLEVRFVNAGMFRFVSILEKTRERAIFMKRQSVEDEENLPEYTLPSTSSASASGSAPYADLPPGYEG